MSREADFQKIDSEVRARFFFFKKKSKKNVHFWSTWCPQNDTQMTRNFFGGQNIRVGFIFFGDVEW